MLAAEFRQFIYHVSEVDVSFLSLLSKTTSVKLIAEELHDSYVFKSTELNPSV